MQFSVLSLFFCLCSGICFPQRAQRIMVAVHSDLIKSDNDGFFEKMQGGVEGSFYFSRKFAATGGIEWWSDDEIVATLGGRFCPIDEAFARIRGLPGKDFSVGGGFSKPLSDNFWVEAMADFYFQGHIAIRAGVSYGLGGRP
jgi:hypothetical protein